MPESRWGCALMLRTRAIESSLLGLPGAAGRGLAAALVEFATAFSGGLLRTEGRFPSRLRDRVRAVGGPVTLPRPIRTDIRWHSGHAPRGSRRWVTPACLADTSQSLAGKDASRSMLGRGRPGG